MNKLDLALLALVCTLPTVALAAGMPTACPTIANVTPAQKVFLVHGRGRTSADWNTLVTDWTSRGYTEGTNLFRVDMTTTFGDNTYCSKLSSYSSEPSVNESYAAALADWIDSHSSSGDQIDLVGHSQGGITCRTYARFYASAHSRTINDLVTMASPNQGITNCTLAGSCTGVNPEDCPDSDFLRKLNGVSPQGDGSNDETPGASSLGPIHYATLVATKDTVVVPFCTEYLITNPQTIQGDDMNCTTPNYTIDSDSDYCARAIQHLTVLTDSNSIRWVYAQVNKD